MTSSYHPQSIEQQAQEYWQRHHSFRAVEEIGRESFYCLSMLPYPSGELHMGHVRNYTIGDVIARYQRMLGKNVLQPMGWDAFGLPAENAALKHGLAPSEWTYQNIAQMRKQLQRLGFAIDWSREVATCDPSYYRWEQWFFLQLFKKGLVYKKNSVVNWDPVDQTVLANEQVVDGRGWRSGALVERREIPQWFIKTTAYADELLEGLDQLPQWPEQVKVMQRNWIGRSEGVTVFFTAEGNDEPLQVYTTRPDTLYGVSYLAIAPEHPLCLAAAQDNPELQQFIDSCRTIKVAEAELATMEKRGMPLNRFVIHPLTQEKIPLWVANYVLMEYGSGAVMAVPAHDQRDFEFAQKYDLLIKPVIAGEWDYSSAALLGYGTLIHSGEFTGMDSEHAISSITEHLEAKQQGYREIHYRLRDWGISRQRYWGAPIPIINCPTCGTVPVPDHDLPVVLPQGITLKGPQSPLTTLTEFIDIVCPCCGEAAKRETDTFDTFMESSWYYLRYCCPDQQQAMLDDRANYWAPVDQYVGGVEHAVMHLLYARFMHKALRDVGLVNSHEPFTRLLTQGMVLKDGHKMSKSKGNTVSPQELIDRYGADTVRLFAIFAAPPEQSLEWSDSAVAGAYRFLRRLYEYAQTQHTLIQAQHTQEICEYSKQQQQFRLTLHKNLQQANQDMERLQLNTVVSAAMKIANDMQALDSQHAESYCLIYESMYILLSMLAPIVPHITHQLWQQLGYEGTIATVSWPKVDPTALHQSHITWVVQINGKRKDQLTTAQDIPHDELRVVVLTLEKVQQALAGNTPKQIVIVPNKLINVVV